MKNLSIIISSLALGACSGASVSDRSWLSVTPSVVSLYGSSDTTDAGAAFAGGGTVEKVEIERQIGLDVSYGRAVGPRTDLIANLGVVQSDMTWETTFVNGYEATNTAKFRSFNLMGGIRRYLGDTNETYVEGAIGVASNSFSEADEAPRAGGAVYATIDGDRTISPAARLAIGTTHAITDNASISVSGSMAYLGAFQSDDTRRDGAEAIGRYKFKDTLSAGFGIGFEYKF